MGEEEASPPAVLPKLLLNGIDFPASVAKPLGSSNIMFLAGAGERGLEIGGKFVVITVIGIYLEEKGAIRSLAGKWGGKSADELSDSLDFFHDIYTGPFEKLIRVTMIMPLTGQQFSEKMTDNCVAAWKSAGVYTEAEAAAVQSLKEVFKPETFPPGASILFTQSPSGSLAIGFSKDSSVPEAIAAVIENKALPEAVLESMIGEHGVSPAAKRSLATRLSELLKESGGAKGTTADVPVATTENS